GVSMKRTTIVISLLFLASVSPLIFPVAESGRSSMDVLAKFALLPAAGLLLSALGLFYRKDDPIAKMGLVGLAAGAVAGAGRGDARPRSRPANGLLARVHAREFASPHGGAIAGPICRRPIIYIGCCRMGLPFLERRLFWLNLRAGVRHLPPLDGNCFWRRDRDRVYA